MEAMVQLTAASEKPERLSGYPTIKYRKKNEKLLSEIKRAVEQGNLKPIVASEHKIADDLYNPIACLLCCGYGIAVFDQAEAKQVINPNVAYELGYVHLLGRSCLILKHSSLTTLPTDVLMKVYDEYTSMKDAHSKVTNWINTIIEEKVR